MPEPMDIQDARPGEESLQVILGALTQEESTLQWPKAPEPSGMETRTEMPGGSLGWTGWPEPAVPGATANLATEPASDAPEALGAPASDVPVADGTGADAPADLVDASAEATATSSLIHESPEADPVSAVDDRREASVEDDGPGASIEEAARRTERSGVRPIQVVKRHPGTTVLAAGALVALAGGAVLGGWVKPVSVSLPSTHTILVDPSSHSDSPPGASTPATTPSTAPSPSTPFASAPPSSVANTPTGTPVTSPAPVGSPSAAAGSGAGQGTSSSSSTTPSAGNSSTSTPSDSSGTGSGATPPSSGSPSGADPGGGSTPTPPPVTTPPTTPPTGGPGSGGLPGLLSGVLNGVFGQN
jgi:hypothetical protein